MGGNLVAMFTALSTMDDAVIKQVHPAHDQSSMKKVYFWISQNMPLHEVLPDFPPSKIRRFDDL